MSGLPIPPRAGRILIIDDERRNLMLLSTRLRSLGYVVFEAPGAERALEIGKTEALDLILSDVMMPGIDGIELTRVFKADPKHAGVPVVLVTAASDNAELRTRGFAAGADDFLQKPINPVELELRVRGQVRIHQLQEDLRARVRLLEAINEQKNELLGTVAHDLRNPLGVVLTFSDLLQGGDLGPLQPSQKHVLTRIMASSEFMLRMINNLLSLAQIEAGHLHLQREETEMASFVRESVEINSIFADKKRIQLTLDADEEMTAFIDKMKFDQVLNNLIGNAIKFSPIGGSVRVKLSKVDQSVEFSVIDDGPGISPSDQERIFKPFTKLKTKPVNGEIGAGLGLAIVRRIVDGHGGIVRVESECGRGSKFVVTIPFEQE